MLGALKIPRPGSAPVITVLALVLLGAIAFAIPPAPLEGGSGGLLVTHSQISEALAETSAQAGYSFLVIDLYAAALDGPAALWVDHLDRVRRRRYPVWGWIDGRTDFERAARMIRSLPLSGLYVYDAPELADALRTVKRGFPIVLAVPFERRAGHEEAAVVMDLETFVQNVGLVRHPVLRAHGLDDAHVREAREAAGGDCVVALLPIGR